jgi:hypothetical protein
MIVAHVTHEAVEKIGGIGTVIAGLTTAEAYAASAARTILVGPLLSTDAPVNRRLGVGGHIRYSSMDAIMPPEWREKFLPIEKTYDVHIIYGTRTVDDATTGKEKEVEVLVVDVFHANMARLNLFKGELFKKFAIASHEYEKIWEYEEYIRLAEPGFEALEAICRGDSNGDGRMLILAHEHMGVPLALRAVLAGNKDIRTVFYAHEVASVRPVVEEHSGHDTMFYNVMDLARRMELRLEDVFPEVRSNYKHPLVKAARYLDEVFAVGDYVIRELEFVDPHFQTMGIDLVYNGVPAERITATESRTSKAKLARYAERLLGYQPSWVFSHVCRPVLSKALWRDLAVLHQLEPMLAERGQTAVHFILGTLAGQRRQPDVRQMERVYGWPVYHELGYPDLCQGEEVVGKMVNIFNRDHRAVRTVFVNQWDWNAAVCGDRMPGDMTFADLRRGADAEFGLSIYEPFGISQFEPLSYGAICLVSNVCGCMGFARRAAEEMPDQENIIEANYLHVPEDMSLDRLRQISMGERDTVEAAESYRLACLLRDRLTTDPAAMERRIARGFELARRMSWEQVVTDYFLPGLASTARL